MQRYNETLPRLLYCTYNKVLSQCGKYNILIFLQICSDNTEKLLSKYSFNVAALTHRVQSLAS